MPSFHPFCATLSLSLRLLLLHLLGPESLGMVQWVFSALALLLCALSRSMRCPLTVVPRLRPSDRPTSFFLLRSLFTISAGLLLLFLRQTLSTDPFGVVFGLLLPLLELLDSLRAHTFFPLLGWGLAGVCCWGLAGSLSALGCPSLLIGLCCTAVGVFLHWVTHWMLSPQSGRTPFSFTDC